MPILLEMKLNCEEKLNYNMSSLFHGALMEKLPTEYVNFLHISQLHPYTQHLESRDGIWYWVLSALDEEAERIIIKDTFEKADQIIIKNRNLVINISEKRYCKVTYNTLTEYFYKRDPERYLTVDFVTPTAFKKQGEYIFYPDIKCIYQSAMNKYDVLSDKEDMLDEDTLNELTNNTKITRYKLRSAKFYLEGVSIPGFLGQITMKISGTDTLANFAGFLLHFAEFSGIGIKTSIGMGSIRLLNEGEKNDRYTD